MDTTLEPAKSDLWQLVDLRHKLLDMKFQQQEIMLQMLNLRSEDLDLQFQQETMLQQLLNMKFQCKNLKLGHPSRVGVCLEKSNQNRNKR